MLIRTAMQSDIPALASLEHATYSKEGYPAMLFAQALMQWPKLCLVATSEQGVVLGYALYSPAAEHGSCWLMSLLVSTESRGQGVGRALCQYARNYLLQLGYSKCLLTVSPENHSALKLYESFSFKRVEYIEHALGENEHRYLMAQTL